MIKFLVGVTQFFMALFTATLFFCAFLMGLALLDYMLDINVKSNLTKALGPRKELKNFRVKLVELIDKLDSPTWKELLDTTVPNNRDDEIEEIKRKFTEDIKSQNYIFQEKEEKKDD